VFFSLLPQADSRPLPLTVTSRHRASSQPPQPFRLEQPGNPQHSLLLTALEHEPSPNHGRIPRSPLFFSACEKVRLDAVAMNRSLFSSAKLPAAVRFPLLPSPLCVLCQRSSSPSEADTGFPTRKLRLSLSSVPIFPPTRLAPLPPLEAFSIRCFCRMLPGNPRGSLSPLRTPSTADCRVLSTFRLFSTS